MKVSISRLTLSWASLLVSLPVSAQITQLVDVSSGGVQTNNDTTSLLVMSADKSVRRVRQLGVQPRRRGHEREAGRLRP